MLVLRAYTGASSLLLRSAAVLAVAQALLTCPARAERDPPAEVLLPWAPERALLPDYCGPASLANVLRYWDRPADQATIGRAVFDSRRRGTLAGDMILWAQQAGLQALSRTGTRNDLRRWLAAGLPVVVLQDLSPEDRRGHFRVVVGYSDPRREFLVCDCTEPSLCAMDYARFDDLWFHFDNWCLLVAPADRMVEASPGDPDNPIQHFDLAEAYLRRGDLSAAREHLREVLRLSPGHRKAGKLLARLRRSDSSASTNRAYLTTDSPP